MNSAESAFGETEKHLDFKHYLVAKPEEYTIAAIAHNFLEGSELRTPAVKIRVEKYTVHPKVADSIEAIQIVDSELRMMSANPGSNLS